jgi:endonuclease/exonuclease/phosphatase (EEP) superfamily protein YafD
MGYLGYLIELASNFLVQYLIVLVALLIVFYYKEAKLLLLVVFALLVIDVVQIVRVYMPVHIQKTDSYEDISILQFNAYHSNSKILKLMKWITNYNLSNPFDIIVLQEITPKAIAQLQPLIDQYQYKILEPEDSSCGAVILSKLPIVSYERHHLSRKYTTINFVTHRSHIPIHLVEMHTLSPVTKLRTKLRNEELKALATLMHQSTTSHKILIGDLNVTPYSPHFIGLERESGLYNVMRGYGIAGTWPSVLPLPLRIPIDNLLVSHNICLLKRTVLQSFGSDHLPVSTKLRIYS